MVDGELRKNAIIETLEKSAGPVSATALGKQYGVSRQVIVQDIALLRANGYDIYATNRGYLLNKKSIRPQRVFKMYHSLERTREEMETIVDMGGHIEDIFIFHRVYGVVKAKLNVKSRRDVNRFMELMEGTPSRPLSDATSGYHYHTISADSEEILEEIFDELKKRNLLASLQDYEPVNFWE